MKKSNVIITVVLAAVSIFLLALWYALGLNRVDEPLDLIVSIVWWAVIVAAVIAVVKVENTRRERVRTVYVANGSYYNSEAGNRILAAGASPTEAIAATLAGLEYGFDKAEAPTKPGTDEPADFDYVVRTSKFDQGSDGSDSQGTWQGEVVTVATGAARPFANRMELAAIIG